MCNYGQDQKKEIMYLDILRSEAIDGLIAAPVNENDQQLKGIIKNGLPVVCVDRGLAGIDVDIVWVNNEEGAFVAVNHLVNSGYKRIAYISGLPSIPSSRMREKGYRRALETNHLFIPELVKYGDSSYESGVSLCAELLGMSNGPDAIFTGNNLITLGALETIHKLKKKIPKDIAIVGFDDMFWSSSLNPPLTAVRQPAYEIGKRAGELLIQRISDPQRPCIQMTLNVELMIRSSC
jgi:LacI family transcriptional regulator/LacI family repressor for deo operon, udp, cdd, tsx, nupC, and nupG